MKRFPKSVLLNIRGAELKDAPQLQNFLDELAAEMHPAMIDFAQRGIRCPSLPGAERAFAQLVLKELQTLGYEATCVDDWGNVMGMVRGNAEGPTIMYNAHLDHVDIGDPSEWGRYDPYGGQIDVAEVENQTGDG